MRRAPSHAIVPLGAIVIVSTASGCDEPSAAQCEAGSNAVAMPAYSPAMGYVIAPGDTTDFSTWALPCRDKCAIYDYQWQAQIPAGASGTISIDYGYRCGSTEEWSPSTCELPVTGPATLDHTAVADAASDDCELLWEEFGPLPAVTTPCGSGTFLKAAPILAIWNLTSSSITVLEGSLVAQCTYAPD